MIDPSIYVQLIDWLADSTRLDSVGTGGAVRVSLASRLTHATHIHTKTYSVTAASRLAEVAKGYTSVCLGRVMRIIPAFGLGACVFRSGMGWAGVGAGRLGIMGVTFLIQSRFKTH